MAQNHIYGGQLVAQALIAAQKTVSKHLYTNSSHSHFIKIGLDKPVMYHVHSLLDSGNFSLRRVDAFQNDKLIFSSQVSFHSLEENFLYHQLCKKPVVKLPEECVSLHRSSKPNSFSHKMSEFMDIRIDDIDVYKNRKSSLEPEFFWIKPNQIEDSDNFTLHDYQVIIAFMSDFNTVTIALRPHAPCPPAYELSLTHTLWFHSTFDLTDWLLFHRDSPCLENNIGFIHGRLWNSKGKLVASTSQEGLIRKSKL